MSHAPPECAPVRAFPETQAGIEDWENPIDVVLTEPDVLLGDFLRISDIDVVYICERRASSPCITFAKTLLFMLK